MERHWDYLREKKQGSGNSKRKVSEARLYVACLGHSKEVSVNVVQWVRGEV